MTSPRMWLPHPSVFPAADSEEQIPKDDFGTMASAGFAKSRTARPTRRDSWAAGKSVAISERLAFSFYDYVWYKENAGLGETKLGRWLGVSLKATSLMSFWVLASGCQVLLRTTVQRVTNIELQTQDMAERCHEYNQAVAPRLGDPDYQDPDGNGKIQGIGKRVWIWRCLSRRVLQGAGIWWQTTWGRRAVHTRHWRWHRALPVVAERSS